MVLAGTFKGGIVVPDDPTQLREGQRIKLIPQKEKRPVKVSAELEKELGRRLRRSRGSRGKLKSHKDVMALLRKVEK